MPAPGNYRIPTVSETAGGTALGGALQSLSPMADRYSQRKGIQVQGERADTKWKQEQDQYESLLEKSKKDKDFVKNLKTAYYEKVQNDEAFAGAAQNVPSLN